MMEFETVLTLVLSLCALGGYGSYRYGRQEYGKGILDGIQMLHTGRLTYESYMEGDVEMLSINIKEEDEE